VSGAELVIRRVIAVPREEVFAAWLDPESIVQWMLPMNTTTVTAEVDGRVGGRFRIVMVDENGPVEHTGRYLTIEPPSRLSFTWISKFTDDRPSVVTIEFHDRGGKTEIVLTHRDLPPKYQDAHRDGWTSIVAKLDAALRRDP
jgi:uncharacterized protein YndB with AHSA1/START domain